MLTKLTFNLSKGSIEQLLEKVKQVEKAVKTGVEQGTLETANLVSEHIIKPATPYDTGESRDSTRVIKKNKHISITQTGFHVMENEFGTGSVGAQAPHPNPPSGWEYKPYYWYFKPTNPQSKYYKLGPNQKPISWRTYGQVASAQMYKGAQAYKQNVKDIIMIKVGDEISKI